MPKKTITGMTILSILIAIFIVNQFCTNLFNIVKPLTVIALVIAIILSILQVEGYWVAWIIFGVLIILTGITHACGPGFANTELGGTLVDAGNASYNALNELNEAEVKAINNIIDSTCEQVSEEDCQLLKNTAKTVKSAQELADFSKKLQKTAKVVDAVSG